MVKFGKNIDRVLRHLNSEPIPYASKYEGTEWVSIRSSFYPKGSDDHLIYETIVDISEELSEEEPDEQEED